MAYNFGITRKKSRKAENSLPPIRYEEINSRYKGGRSVFKYASGNMRRLAVTGFNPCYLAQYSKPIIGNQFCLSASGKRILAYEADFVTGTDAINTTLYFDRKV